jgi:hypothetical protein
MTGTADHAQQPGTTAVHRGPGARFTPEAVRAALAARFTGYNPGHADGYTVTGPHRREILVCYRLADGSSSGTADAVRARCDYTVALRVAGYQARLEGPCVVITMDTVR